MLTLIFVARSLPEHYAILTGWLTEWVLAFRWAHVAFALFLLVCLVLHFVTRIVLTLTRNFFYGAPVS